MSKNSIDHYEAILQEFTEHPERAVELVKELSRQANEFEERVHTLERQRDYLLSEIVIQDNDYDLYHCPLPVRYPCSHRSIYGWGCVTGRRDQRRECWIKALEEGIEI